MSDDGSYTIYADESGLTERFLAYGAILLPTAETDRAEETLQGYAEPTLYRGREFSFKKCSKGEIEIYKGFAGHFWTMQNSFHIDFRAMVVDTRQNPMESTQFGCNSWEDGFYKFYHHFLFQSARIVAPQSKKFHLVVGNKTDEYPHRTQILETTVKGALSRVFGADYDVFELERGQPKDKRLHQMADVLLGAVTHRLNKGDMRPGHKCELRNYVQSKVGKELSWDFMPGERPFNIWSFTAKGQKRWAPGSWSVGV